MTKCIISAVQQNPRPPCFGLYLRGISVKFKMPKVHKPTSIFNNVVEIGNLHHLPKYSQFQALNNRWRNVTSHHFPRGHYYCAIPEDCCILYLFRPLFLEWRGSVEKYPKLDHHLSILINRECLIVELIFKCKIVQSSPRTLSFKWQLARRSVGITCV